MALWCRNNNTHQVSTYIHEQRQNCREQSSSSSSSNNKQQQPNTIVCIRDDHFFFFFFFGSIPFIIFALLFSHPPSRNSEPGSHSREAASFPPLPTMVRAMRFYREKISALSSLVDSRRIVLTHARRSKQLILFLFLQILKIIINNKSKSRHGGIRTHGPTLVAFEGYH